MSGQQKILVVDDDEINRIVLTGMLESDARCTVFAENGVQAIEQYKQEMPDLILMDVMMPEMDGLQATKIIKELAGDDFIPIIFLTSITDEDELAKCVAVGGDDFLTKPFSRTILEAKLAAFHRTRELYKEVQQQNQVIMQEYEYAEKIYSRLFKRGVLQKLPFNFISNPQSMFNGDILLAGRRPDGGLNIFVGDATGHGLPAAVGVLPVADIFYSLTEAGKGIAEIVPAINEKLFQFLPPELFLCAGFVELEADFQSAKIWNAGLPEALVYSREKERVDEIFHSVGMPLGIAGNKSLDIETISWDIRKGEYLYFFTDGVTESHNEQGEMFGIERLTMLISEAHKRGEPFMYIEKVLAEYRGQRQQSDDLTIIEIDPSALRASK